MSSPRRAAAAKASEEAGPSTTPKRTNKSPEETVTMSVLGMQAGSDEYNMKKPPPSTPKGDRKPPPAQNVAKRAAGAAERDKSWWEKVARRGRGDELGRNADYTSLGTPPSASSVASPSAAAAMATTDVSILSSGSARSKETVEDRMRQDCSFFYQGIEDPIQQKRGRKFPQPHNASLSPGTSLANVPARVLSSRDGADFHARYEKLNRTIHIDDDLELIEESENFEDEELGENDSSRMASISDIQNSTLFFRQDGKLLMRVPKDNIRLIMDHDLEPGIISVEQWRRVDPNEVLPSGQTLATTGPPLRYVMTVDDDLYRRIIQEVSHQLDPPYHEGCFDDSGYADIRVAILAITGVLVMLFLLTVDFHEE